MTKSIEPEIRTVAVAKIVPHYDDTNNPNTMDSDTYAALVASIRTSGFLQPMLVERLRGSKLRVVDGHHRLRAAQELGLRELPCIVVAQHARNAAVGVGLNRARGELDISRAVSVLQELSSDIDADELAALSAFSTADLESLVLASSEVTVDLDSMPASEPRQREPKDSYTLEIVFTEKAEYLRARKKLRALGDGELSAGLLSLLEEKS